jgi:hypothetical protein
MGVEEGLRGQYHLLGKVRSKDEILRPEAKYLVPRVIQEKLQGKEW